jgi:hypothetical protein
VNKQVHTYNTRNNNDYTNLELYNNKPSGAGIFYNKVPNIKQIGNNNQFKKELKDLLRDAIIQKKIISMTNSVILATDKQLYRISYISNKCILIII